MAVIAFAVWIAAAAAPGIVAAQEPPAAGAPTAAVAKAIDRFDLGHPAYARIVALNDIANALDDQPSTKRNVPAIRAAWDKAITDGSRTKVLGTDMVHPLVGRALIARSNMEMAAGDNAAGLDYARRGVALVYPFRDFYPNFYVQGISLIGYFQSAAGQPADAAATIAKGVEFYEKYLTSVPVEKRTRLLHMAKSNAEFSYAMALSKLGQNDRAVEYQFRSVQSRVAGFGEDHPDTISAYYNHALMLLRAGRTDEAEAAARRAVERAVEHVDVSHATYARSLEALGLILSRNGSRSESVEYLKRSLEIKRKTIGTLNLFFHAGLLNLGDILLQLERYDEAGTVLAEAAAGFRAIQGSASHDGARAAGYQAIANFADGHAADAVDQLQGVFDGVRARDAKEREIGRIVLPDLILAKLAIGHADAARALATSFAGEVRAFDDAPPFLIAYADALRGYADQGVRADWSTGARAAARRMIEIVRNNHSLVRDGQLPQRERAALDLSLRVAADSGDPTLALEAMTVLAGSKIARANRLLAQRLTDTDPELAARVRTLQDTVRAFQAADAALLKALPTETGAAAVRAKRDAAGQALSAARAAIARDYPQWVEVHGTEPVELKTLRARLGPDEGMLGVIPAYDSVYVLSVTRDGAHVHRTSLNRREMFTLVSRVRTSLAFGRFDTAASHSLYKQIFSPAVAAQLARVRSLRIVPTGAFASLPFATLLERSVAKADRRSRYLLKRFAISVAPGFGMSGDDTRTARTPLRDGHFLGVGAPTPFVSTQATPAAAPSRPGLALTTASYFRGGAVASGALAALPTLPGAVRELRAVADQYGTGRATLLLGDDASEARLRSMDLTSYSVMLFATHGLVSGEMEGIAEPSLVLAPPGAGDKANDGLLGASEIGLLRLNADWVILSACNTAAGEGGLAPAYSGLAQAFRYAGARSLLLSHWPVRDDAAAYITVQAVSAAAKGVRRDVALQQAMLRLLADRSISDGDDPYVWAPYVLLN